MGTAYPEQPYAALVTLTWRSIFLWYNWHMVILSIESSADETSISLIDAQGDFPTANYTILGNALRSQIELHNQYGGIFPMMAKREHAKAVVPLLGKYLHIGCGAQFDCAKHFPK